jgi:hypothetical protein
VLDRPFAVVNVTEPEAPDTGPPATAYVAVPDFVRVRDPTLSAKLPEASSNFQRWTSPDIAEMSVS